MWPIEVPLNHHSILIANKSDRFKDFAFQVSGAQLSIYSFFLKECLIENTAEKSIVHVRLVLTQQYSM